MSKVVSLRLRDDQVERLKRAARRLGRPLSTTAAVLLEEALRERDFPYVEFRDSAVGRQPYVQGTRLAVWQVKWLARHFEGDAARIAAHLEMPVEGISEALRYAEVFREEIDAAVDENDRIAEDPERYIPNVRIVRTDASAS